jgi:hypothetical protein
MRVVAALLIALGWSAVMVKAMTDYEQRKCDSPIGRLAVQLKLDRYYSGCRCMKHSLNFSDPCNSAYISTL